MNVATMQQPLSFSRRLVPSVASSRGLSSSVTAARYSGRSSGYAPSFRSIKCVSVSPEASIGESNALLAFFLGFGIWIVRFPDKMRENGLTKIRSNFISFQNETFNSRGL